MKTMLTKLTFLCALTVAIIALNGCDDKVLPNFDPEENVPRTVSAGNIAGPATKRNERIIIPISVKASTSVTKAFDVKLQVNPDTIQHIITEQGLTDTELLAAADFEFPNAVTIPYGSDSAVFEVSIDITALERLYGKKAAFALDLASPSKSNAIDENNNSLIIILDTEAVIVEDEIRYLSFINTGEGRLEAQLRQNYVAHSTGIDIPLGIQLAGRPGLNFTVETVVNNDTIAALVSQGLLPENTIALQRGEYFLNENITVPTNVSAVDLDIEIPNLVINSNLDKVLALSVKLASPSRHLLDPEKSQVLVLIYPNRIAEVNITGQRVAFSVSRDHNDGPDHREGSPKVVDNDINTKFLQADFIGDLWMTLEYAEPRYAGAYLLTSANDAAGRDPRSWELSGSNDGTNWTALDSQSGETFASRFLAKRYEFEQTEPYRFYRISITENNGDNLFQLAEWRLMSVPR